MAPALLAWKWTVGSTSSGRARMRARWLRSRSARGRSSHAARRSRYGSAVGEREQLLDGVPVARRGNDAQAPLEEGRREARAMEAVRPPDVELAAGRGE